MKDFVILLVFSSWISLSLARPRDFYLKKNENYLRRFLKSFAIGHDELFCPRTVEGSGSILSDTGTKLACGRDYDLCSDDSDCEPGLMCCPAGCIYKCVVPEAPKTAVATDWIEEPEGLTVGGNAWLIEGGESDRMRDIECSTSVFPGIEPLNCMNGYTCVIQIQEDKANQIPNRGICIISNNKDLLPESQLSLTRPKLHQTEIAHTVRVSSLSVQAIHFNSDNYDSDASKSLNPPFDSFSSIEANQPIARASCLLNGKEVPHGYHDTVNCNLCFCKDGELFCQMQPCLNQYGK